MPQFCPSGTSRLLLDFGPQPISNRFAETPKEANERFPIALSQCEQTGLIFLSTSIPERELVPRVSWLTYNEPEDHLDEMVAELMQACELNAGDLVGGVSFKDDTTLARFEKRGLRSWRVSLEEDLRLEQPGLGVESIQRELNPRAASGIAERKGKAKLLVVRHILEHVYNGTEFLSALSMLAAPDGYILFEVPDCSRALDGRDYTTIWEEHTFYFTPTTLRTLLEASGFDIVFSAQYPYPFENSLCVLVRASSGARTRPAQFRPAQSSPAGADVSDELRRGETFARGFEPARDMYQAELQKLRSKGPLAVFGAGHLTTTFLSLFELAPLFSFVIDDNQHKAGKYFPGTELIVRPSITLGQEKVALCLLGVNPMSEAKILSKLELLVAQSGGIIRSMFPSSTMYLGRDLA